MGDTVLYIITTYNGKSMYQYIFDFEYHEYFMESDIRPIIEEAFFEKSGIKGEKIIDIKLAEFVRYVS